MEKHRLGWLSAGIVLGVLGSGMMLYGHRHMADASPPAPQTAVRHAYLAHTIYDEDAPPDVELRNVRKMIVALDPAISNMPTFQRAVALRELLHSHIFKKQPDRADYDWQNTDRMVWLALHKREYGMVCGGFAITYLTVLRAFDIPARYVGLFESVQDIHGDAQSHATVEVYLDHHWVALDAMFNFSLRDAKGRYLDWDEARFLEKHGEAVLVEIGGKTRPYKDFTGMDHPVEHTNYIITGPASIGSYRIPISTTPSEWDGTLNYSDGSSFDMHASVGSAIYAELAEPSASNTSRN